MMPRPQSPRPQSPRPPSPRHVMFRSPALHQLLLLSFALALLHGAAAATAENVTLQLFGTNNKFMPAAFADFNSDKHTDVIAIVKDKNECSVKVLLAYIDPPLLRPDGPRCFCPGGNVISVVPGDFDGDGALDLMMLSNTSSFFYDVYVAWGDLKNLTCPTEKMLTVYGQPLMLDYNGDMIADLFGEDENKARSFWLFNSKRTAPEAVPMTQPGNVALKPLRVPSSHGFIDLDGDLAADLFVTADGQFEIWTNTEDGFILSDTIPIPSWVKVIGQTTFMDVSLDGHNDIVVVFCGLADCSDGKVYIYNNNKFLPLGFSLVDGNSMSWKYPTTEHQPYPYTDVISLRSADYDLDGYPDLLVTLLDSSDKPQVSLYTHIHAAKNVYS